jgi:hypothetical protein
MIPYHHSEHIPTFFPRNRCRRLSVRIGVMSLIILAWVIPAIAADPLPFVDEIAPLFKTRCVKCHGPAKAEGGLNLSLASTIARGGKNGPIVRPHDVENSLLWERISTDEMPPKHPLSELEKGRIKRWIESGAPGLVAASKAADARDHWSFRALKRPAPPSVKDARRVLHPIDRFIEAPLEAANATLAAEASRPTLIHRVALVLTGLPPTAEEVDSFLSDSNPDAYNRMVERFLASPHYGERWGKFWLDAAGYADSNGYFNADSERPLAYRYRDYVIKAINEDRPFDRFVREQIAGDELGEITPGQTANPETIDRLIATHFLRNGQDGSGESDGNPDEVRVDRYTALESCEQITASSLLGLTIQCAKCHAHKFEPISHEDYYRFQAIFTPVFPAAEEKLWIKPAARFVLAPGPGEKSAWDQEIAALEVREKTRKPGLAEWIRKNRPQGDVLFLDDFNTETSLAKRWSNLAPTDDRPGGTPAVTLDSDKPPAARIEQQRLKIVAGTTLDSWISTKQSFDWSPDHEGDSIQVTFDLIDNKATSNASPAQRVGYFIATHDFDDSGKLSGGNILIDGHPSSSTSVHVDYPGSDSVAKGSIGHTGYEPGGNYGVRVVNTGKGTFRLEHLVDGATDEKPIVLSARDLPDGGFGFEYHADRGFVVDNIKVERFAASPSEAGARLATFSDELQRRRKELETVTSRLQDLRKNPPGKIAWASDVSATPPDTHLLLRGDYSKPGAVIPASPLSVLTTADAPFSLKPRPGARTTGRRLAFANWLTDPKERASGLMARVQVNRVWQSYFGNGIVSTPENMGISGAVPTHPQLLDWLAAEFVESGWSLKQVHRAILNSGTFRQTSEVASADDQRLDRFPTTRLDAEAIRDAMLAVSGDLDSTMGGPSVPFTTRDDGAVVIAESQPGGHRRSVYLRYRRTQVISLLQVFDAPSIVYNSLRRPRTAQPLQSLALLNSEFVRARAGSFARRLDREQPDEQKRIARSYVITYSRSPTSEEQSEATAFLDAQAREYPSDPNARKKAWVDFCQSLLVSNEFLYLD